MATFLICHGAWSGGWSWKKMRGPLADRGHALWTPTCTGLGERSHLADPRIDLETHVNDIMGVLEYEDLREVVLVGHSYGGMVATGVADRAPERVAHLVYLDAFVPEDGESVLDGQPPRVAEQMRQLVAAAGDGWRLPPRPLSPDIAPADADWLNPRRSAQPFATFTQGITLTGRSADIPRAYIYCRDKAGDDPFRAVAERVRARPGWRYFELGSGHLPNITMPDRLAELLDRIARGAG